MSFEVLCLLILLNSLQTNARGRIPIPRSFENNASIQKFKNDTNSNEHLSLPRGFDPQSPPTNPLLYPFATEQPAWNKTSTSTGWRPIVTEYVMTQSSSNQPLLQDRTAVSTESQQDFNPLVGPVVETVVYGTWKPEPPSLPNLAQPKEDDKINAENKSSAGLLDNVMNGKLGGFIEEMGRKKPIPDSVEKSGISNESVENVSARNKNFNKKLGRRKMPIANYKQLNETEPTSTQPNSMEVVKLNSTDPALLSVVKQINESVEANNKFMKKVKTISKEWPTDFLNSPESDQTQESSMQDNSYSYLGDSSEPPQALNGLLDAEIKTSPTAINITKMGIPYENQNSDEEPSICVPLAVREPSVSNPMEIVEVERVYCFPLPPTEVKSKIERANDTLVFDKDAKFNVLSYEELMASKSRSVHKSFQSLLSVLVLSFSLAK